MKVRLIENGIFITVLPVLTLGLSCYFWEHTGIILLILPFALLLQTAAVLVCRKNLKEMIRPSEEVLQQMQVQTVPAPFDKGRFKWDTRIVGAMGWLSVPAQASVLAAKLFPIHAMTMGTVAARPRANAMILVAGLLSIFLATLCMLLWAKLSQAAAIANEGSERRRYLLQGFAVTIDQPGTYARYLRVRHPVKEDPKAVRPNYGLNEIG